MSLAEYVARLEFEPDRFQQRAFDVLERGESVVVSAPTGSGKTLIAEAAVHIAVERGRRAFYTTPIKALSNQKYHELSAVHGSDRVGLLTGDNSINGDAPIVVMTTEVLRNMIYQEASNLDEVEYAVLDEVHYLQDPVRGPVWEEIIIHAPRSIQLVCLSATIANSGELADWVRERRGSTSLIVESERPVPLESLYFLKDLWAEEQLKLFPMFVGDAVLRPNRTVARLLSQVKGRRRRFVTPRRSDVIEHLATADMLPVIYFVFSRAGCDSAAATVAAAGARLTGPEDRRRLREIAGRRTAHLESEDRNALGYDRWLAQLESGVAAHHAGMIPAFKEAVEEAFSTGLVKVVFATETLALGINMPARTVVLESMSKFNGETHVLLRPGDYTQLTGRAGRRGIDEHGYGVSLYSPFVRFEAVASIAGAGAHPLQSSFRPTYNMAANLIANYPQDEAEGLLEASFAQYQRRSALEARKSSIDGLEQQLERLEAKVVCERGDVFAFLEMAGDSPARTHRGVLDLEAGDVIEQTGSWGADRSVILQRDRWRSSDPRLVTVSDSGRLRRVRLRELAPGTIRLGRLVLPQPFRPKDRRFHAKVARLLDNFEPKTEEVLSWTVSERAGNHPVGSCPDVSDHVRAAQKVAKLKKEISRRRRKLGEHDSDLLTDFREIVGLLTERNYLHGWALTTNGEDLRVVYNELDLLLVESIRAGAFDDLSPADFAAIASVFVYDPRGSGGAFSSPTRVFEDRWKIIDEAWRSLIDAETRRRLNPSRNPEPGYGETTWLWASGASLEEVMEEEDLAAGDFVRNLRQVLDLLRQLRDGFPALAGTAREAIRAVDRGVVAAGGQQ